MPYRSPIAVTAALAFLCLACPAARSVPPLPPAPPAPAIPTDPVDAYTEAVTLLRRGRDFSRAARLLRAATAARPEIAAYRGALGCALASRAASVAFAAVNRTTYERDRKRYESVLAEWTAAQRGGDASEARVSPLSPEQTDEIAAKTGLPPDKVSAYYAQFAALQERLWRKYYAFAPGSPRPLPPVLRTQDDGRPFLLDDQEARAEFGRLRDEAVAAFGAAVTAAGDENERAEYERARAWGLLLLRRHATRIGAEPPPVNGDAIAEGMRRAAALRPDDPVVWRSLGDILDYRDDRRVGARSEAVHREATSTYEKALSLRPRDEATLLSRLVDMAESAPRPGVRRMKDRPIATADREIAYLRRLARLETANGRGAHRLALSLLMGVKDRDARWLRSPVGREALALIERGNAAPVYRPLGYVPAVPAHLSAAWRYLGRGDDAYAYAPFPLIKLCDALLAAAEAESAAGDDALALRALRAATGVGGAIRRGLPDDGSARDARFRMTDLAAVSMEEKTYPRLIALLRRTGDPDAAQAAEAEHRALRAAQRERNDRSLAHTLFGYGDH